ncbi:MAG TPA: M20 family metallopeptidase [Bacillota bacterium]|nr:M20 family metallopeptidase [Bacillota bacterium]
MPLQSAIDYVRDHAPLFQELSDRIWESPELGLHETKSSAVLADALEADGFHVARGLGGMPTAFTATYGEGKPVIALLGEFDALPSLSQARGVAEPRALVPSGPGHGCGHNLLGTAAAAAAMAVKRAIERGEVRGTVRFYGCPAEETLVGKVFMVKAGLFNDVDCALTWHPASMNGVSNGSSLAMNSAKFTFHGISSHAAAAPDRGRSALDAVELMNVGVNFLREHVPATTRIHYVITDGGLGPNVVPNRAEVWYYVRAPKRGDVEEIYARVLNIAKGACLMTDTTHDVRLLCGCYDTLPNRALGDRLHENLTAIGAPRFTDEERQLARQLQATVGEGAVAKAVAQLKKRGAEITATDLFEGIAPQSGFGEPGGGSTDVGDVSYVVPTAQVRCVTAPIATPGHSWQNVVAVGSSIGQKGMGFAAQTMAATCCDLMREPELVARAHAEFREATAAAPYLSPVRDVAEPPLNG